MNAKKTMELFFCWTDQEGLLKKTKGLTVDDVTRSVPVYQDFAYLSPLDTIEEGSRYLLAIDLESHEVVGVMKTKRYRLPDHAYVAEENREAEPNYLAIRYVDVKESHKRKGVARSLYQTLNKMAKSCLVMVGSGRYSEEGKRADLKALREREMKRFPIYETIEEYLPEFYDEFPELL